jgi:hypothetical protein
MHLSDYCFALAAEIFATVARGQRPRLVRFEIRESVSQHCVHGAPTQTQGAWLDGI